MTFGKQKPLSDTTDLTDQPDSSKSAPVVQPIDNPQVEPIAEPTPNQDSDPMKSNCAYCKAEMVATLAFRFGLVLLVLAFSFKLIKTAK